MTETTSTTSGKRKPGTRQNADRRGAGKKTTPLKSKDKLNIFISYATEDIEIATAVHNALTETLGVDMVTVFLDKSSIRPGEDFKEDITTCLDNTDILILIYTGAMKPSHSYTGWELGYFSRVMRESNSKPRRRIVSLYLNEPPSTAYNIQGIGFNLKPETLSMSEEKFASNFLKNIGENHEMVKFLNDLNNRVNDIREENDREKIQISSDKTAQCVRKMLNDIFSSLTILRTVFLTN